MDSKTITTDLIVVGGGLAGCFAAIGAKRTNPNIDVWLVENYGFLGGMATMGYVFPMMGYAAWDPVRKQRKRLTGGLFQEMMGQMHSLGYTSGIGPFYGRFDSMMLRCVS